MKMSKNIVAEFDPMHEWYPDKIRVYKDGVVVELEEKSIDLAKQEAPPANNVYVGRTNWLEMHFDMFLEGNKKNNFELYLKYGADVNHVDWRGNTFLTYAVSGRNIDLARFLIQHGADVNIKNIYKSFNGKIKYDSLLEQAADTNNFEMVKLLVESGADVSYISEGYKHGYSALYWSAYNKNAEMFFYLLNKGAKWKDNVRLLDLFYGDKRDEYQFLEEKFLDWQMLQDKEVQKLMKPRELAKLKIKHQWDRWLKWLN